jgi:hypothetical protein
MNAFLQKHASKVTGVLSGFDRLVLRGVLRSVAYTGGMLSYLCHHRIRLKDFGAHAEKVTQEVIQASIQPAQRQGRPIVYLNDNRLRKDDFARQLAGRDGIRAGLICILKAVEPCLAYDVRGNRETQQIELCLRQRKCLHLYHYLIHPVFGFLHVRLQTWYPFSLQVCLNGREWLSRQLDRAGLAYTRHTNSFSLLEDLPRAQRLMDRQLSAPWERLLAALVCRVHPAAKQFHVRTSDNCQEPLRYYWSVPQSEWATDVMFQDRESLLGVYNRLVRHSILVYGPDDVLRFLGKRQPTRCASEVLSDVQRRVEGTRIKYRYRGNSLKIYDKGNNVRFETTMNQPQGFKVYRTAEGKPDEPPQWRPLRKGLADLKRRAQVCQAANERLMQAQAALVESQSLQELTGPLCRPVYRPRSRCDGTPLPPRRFRALNPFAEPDAQLLQAISRPEFCERGFRNRDLVVLLHQTPAPDDRERHRHSAAVTRKLALLRAHQLIQKIPRTHRYQITPLGRKAIAALLAARNLTLEQLTRVA